MMSHKKSELIPPLTCLPQWQSILAANLKIEIQNFDYWSYEPHSSVSLIHQLAARKSHKTYWTITISNFIGTTQQQWHRK
jgi:hypothetical protein